MAGPSQIQSTANGPLDPKISANINKYIEKRLNACQSDAEKDDVNLFAKILYQVINSNDKHATKKDYRYYRDNIIDSLNSDSFWQDECEVKYYLEQDVLNLSILNFKSHIANHFANDALVQQAAKELYKLVEDGCMSATKNEAYRDVSTRIANAKSHYYLAIHAIEASHQYAFANQKSSNSSSHKYFTDYADINSDYPKLIDRVQGPYKPNAFLDGLGMGLAVLGCAILMSPFILAPLAMILPPVSLLAVCLVTAATAIAGIGTLMTGAFLCDNYRQRPWSQSMGLFSQAITASKHEIESPAHSDYLRLNPAM